MTTTTEKNEEARSINQELIDKLAVAVAKHVRATIPIEVDLWSISDIAAYLKRSPSHVQQRYCPLPNFPDAIRLPGPRMSHPLYRASEVIEWAERYRDRRRAA